jgi:hypothetical protein
MLNGAAGRFCRRHRVPVDNFVWFRPAVMPPRRLARRCRAGLRYYLLMRFVRHRWAVSQRHARSRPRGVNASRDVYVASLSIGHKFVRIDSSNRRVCRRPAPLAIEFASETRDRRSTVDRAHRLLSGVGERTPRSSDNRDS